MLLACMRAFAVGKLAVLKTPASVWRTWTRGAILANPFGHLLIAVFLQVAKLQAGLYLCEHPCASHAVGISHAPLHLPTGLCNHVLQALRKQEPELRRPGLGPASGRVPSCPPSAPSCCLFQCSATFWCQQLYCSAEVSWVLPEILARELYVHAPWVLPKPCFWSAFHEDVFVPPCPYCARGFLLYFLITTSQKPR